MSKLNELLERRASAIDTMKANEENGGEAFDKAKTEYETVTLQIERAKLIDTADRQERGRELHGDGKLTSEIRSKFSTARAIAGAAGLPGVEWGFEREIQGELAKRAGRAAQGVYIPTEVFERRVLTTSAAGELVETDHRPELYVSALTAATVVRQLGATVLDGLVGNVSIPRETDSPAIGWVAENAALSADDANFDAVTLTPKHAGALSEWSRNMVLQTSPAVEQLLRTMLGRNLALAIDRAAILGGGSNEPVGVLAMSGIQTQAYADSLFETNAEMIAKADIANVDARRSFLSSNTIKKLAMTALDFENRPVGIPAIFHNEAVTFSNQVPTNLGAGTNEHGHIYADWSQLLMGIWSEIDILVNPFESTAYTKGSIMVRAMATVDLAMRHKAAFVKATGTIPASMLALPEAVA